MKSSKGTKRIFKGLHGAQGLYQCLKICLQEKAKCSLLTKKRRENPQFVWDNVTN